MTGLPTWLHQLAAAAPGVTGEQLSRFVPPDEGGRESAVLVLFGEGPYGPDVLLIERAATLRSHAGQPAFPGGAVDPGDGSPTAAALREAVEETGLDPTGVEVLAELPPLWLPPSGFVVVPVLAWWREPSAVGPVDPAECAAVARVPLAELTDPANRLRVQHPSGYVGAAFEVGGMLVWGFTAGLLDRLLELGGWSRPWDHDRTRLLPAELAARSVPDPPP
jgi:8-oxo-dGTP pyrophosphatase MutT (NUDIX family)